MIWIETARRRWAWASSILAIACVGFVIYLYQWKQDEPPPVLDAEHWPEAVVQRLQASVGSAGAVKSSSAASSSPESMEDFFAKLLENRGNAVDWLVRTGGTEEALLAYVILDACIYARWMEAHIAQATDPQMIEMWRKQPPPQAAMHCANLSPGQLTMRKPLLIKAALAGELGSYWAYKRLLQDEFKDDVDLLAALPAVSEAAVRAGDALAIEERAIGYDACKDSARCERDPYNALVMQTAFNLIAESEHKGAGIGDRRTSRLVKELGEPKAQEAIEAGKALAFRTRGVK